MVETNAILQDILLHPERLPPIPAVALQLNSMLDNTDVSANDLSKVVVLDPTLTSQMLKLCNSAQYGFTRKIGTMQEAVSILGHQEIRSLLFTILAHSLLNRPVDGYALEKGALWENALVCATYSRYLAQKCKFSDPELAFIAGLLRDIGKIALGRYLEGQIKTLQTRAEHDKIDFSAAEEILFGTNHTIVGAALSAQWNFPDTLVKVSRYHHQPSSLPPSTPPNIVKLVGIVHLADIYTLMSGTGLGTDGLMYTLDMSVLKHLGLSIENNTLEIWFSELLGLQEQIQSLTQSLLDK